MGRESVRCPAHVGQNDPAQTSYRQGGLHLHIWYTNVRSQVRVNGQYSEEFGVGVGVHQRSVLNPLLFILVLEVLSHEFRTGVPWELLYADDLAVIADTLE